LKKEEEEQDIISMKPTKPEHKCKNIRQVTSKRHFSRDGRLI
jgi:hypothetical protein